MRKLKIFETKQTEPTNNEILLKQYRMALKMLESAWNQYNNTNTTSSIYHLKACEERLNEVIQDCVKNNVTYNKINVKTLGE